MRNQIFISFVFLFLSLWSGTGMAQNLNDSVLIRINGRSFTVGQFIDAYRKNNTGAMMQNILSIEEYLELYINFQLKVHQAISQGMDTTNAFRQELNNYRAQLAQSFLTDRQVTKQLLEEAYQRVQYDIRALHILASVSPHALPADTLRAWERIQNARKRIMSGETFEDVAIEVSDDPFVRDQQGTATRAPISGNRGDLGFFTVFEMVYPFESAAFQTPVGELSQPVRSEFGYHLIKVSERLPAMGRAKVAHIMKMVEPNNVQADASALSEITALHQRLMAGEDFSALASQYSDDRASAANQGILPPFTSSRMVPEFISAISRLDSPGSFSSPVRTSFGWHLIKLIEKAPPPSFNEIAADLAFRLENDKRSELSQRVVIDRLKSEYQFSENPHYLQDLIAHADSAVLSGNFDSLPASLLNKPLFAFAGKSATVEQFGQFISHQNILQPGFLPDKILMDAYQRFVDQSIIGYEDSVLEKKYPEFRSILQEFHDGILLFELKDQRVWTKALQDTVGMRTFFNENSHLFQWPERVHATIFKFPTRQMARNARNTLKAHQSIVHTPDSVLKIVNDNIFPGLQQQVGTFGRNQEGIPPKTPWNKGISRIFEANDTYKMVVVHAVLPPAPQLLDEVRGRVVAEYQTYLGKKWIKELRETYQVSVNRRLLRKIRP